MEGTSKDVFISENEICLFNKMINISINFKIAIKILSFWLFLRSRGFVDISKKIILADNTFLRCVCAEAEMALALFERKHNQPKPFTSSISCPVIWKLASENLSPADVFEDMEKAYEDILAIQERLCNFDFHENTKGKSEDPNADNKGIHASKLNPSAKEWKPAPENERTLFMTFSRGRPLSKPEIMNFFDRYHFLIFFIHLNILMFIKNKKKKKKVFSSIHYYDVILQVYSKCFTRKYGACVEDVFIHKPQGRDPEFGKIVFKFSWIPNLILENNESVLIYIGHNTICLKKFKSG